eukprot:6321814-Heterocapsa_arctica.AAC.1
MWWGFGGSLPARAYGRGAERRGGRDSRHGAAGDGAGPADLRHGAVPAGTAQGQDLLDLGPGGRLRDRHARDGG